MLPAAVLRPPIRTASLSYLISGEHMRLSTPYVGGGKGKRVDDKGSVRTVKEASRQSERVVSSQRGVRTVRKASGRLERLISSQRDVRTVREACKQPERRQKSQKSIKTV